MASHPANYTLLKIDNAHSWPHKLNFQGFIWNLLSQVLFFSLFSPCHCSYFHWAIKSCGCQRFRLQFEWTHSPNLLTEIEQWWCIYYSLLKADLFCHICLTRICVFQFQLSRKVKNVMIYDNNFDQYAKIWAFAIFLNKQFDATEDKSSKALSTEILHKSRTCDCYLSVLTKPLTLPSMWFIRAISWFGCQLCDNEITDILQIR